jgi:C-3',4' desaturase CrtD
MSGREANERIVIVGGGVGGLSTAAALARRGLPVTVLEAHVYPGGCAGTFFHKGYRFDAGATLAGGFYPGGPMDLVAREAGLDSWPAHPADPTMAVHLSPATGGGSIVRYGDARRLQEHLAAFGPAGERFFAWQERTADALWELALRLPPWPATSLWELLQLGGKGIAWLLQHFPRHLDPRLVADAFRPVAAHLHDAPAALRQFVDGQLLIAAQAGSATANALYGASALDLPRRGVVHLEGGMGAIAQTLAEAVRRAGGEVLLRQDVTRIEMQNGRPVAVETRQGRRITARRVIVNLPPWNIARLLGDDAPARLKRLPPQPEDGWGAFMLYVGLESHALPEGQLHHQVIQREPLGEGNSIFISASPAWDSGRAPVGRRAVTISTHTSLKPWWQLAAYDQEMYERRKQAYVDRMLRAAERVIPNLRNQANLIMPGTPVTFKRFTRREWGWVGGFPQTSLTRAWSPRLAPGLWMVGDSIFPGQSTAAVAMGGLRVAHAVLHDWGRAPHLATAPAQPQRTATASSATAPGAQASAGVPAGGSAHIAVRVPSRP